MVLGVFSKIYVSSSIISDDKPYDAIGAVVVLGALTGFVSREDVPDDWAT